MRVLTLPEKPSSVFVKRFVRVSILIRLPVHPDHVREGLIFVSDFFTINENRSSGVILGPSMKSVIPLCARVYSFSSNQS